MVRESEDIKKLSYEFVMISAEVIFIVALVFIQLLIYSFIHSFIHLLICSLIHLFIRSLIS